MDFTELNLHDDLIKGIAKAGYKTCTPVQEQVLTDALEGSDLYVQSQTGTGKTAAFLITTIQQMLVNPKMQGKKALVMVPTRELAVQVEEEARTLLSGTKLIAGSFYGGVGYNQQTAMLKKGVDILIGTPGRVLDLQESSTMDLSAVNFLVIDEADRMFDMGFYPDLRRLIKVLPDSVHRQTMLFSATLNTYVKNLAWEYTDNAHEITIETENVTVNEIDQVLLHISSDDKVKLLLGIIKNEKPESVIVFCNTKRSCEVIAKRLKINGIECEFIIGDLPQSKRLQVLDSFKRGSLSCLVATDVAARGIDVDDLAMVINFDLPNEAENYVHRTGRTARAGKTGKAYTFCSEQDVYSLPAIERYIGTSIPAIIPGEEMFTEDKSANVYIRTTNYFEDRNDRNGGDRSSSNRSGRGRSSDGSSMGRSHARHSSPSRQNAGQGRSDRFGRDAKDGRPSYGDRNGQANRTDNDTRLDKDERLERSSSNNSRGQGANKSATGRKNKSEYANKNDRSNKKSFDSDTRQTTSEPNMANLSFDERMELYRKKYGSSSDGGNAQRVNTQKNNAQKSGEWHKGKKHKAGGKAVEQGASNDAQNTRNDDTKKGQNKHSNKHTDAKSSNRKDFEHKNSRDSYRHDSQTSKKPSSSANKPVAKPATATKKGLFKSIKGFFSKK